MHGLPSKKRIRRLLTAVAAAAASFVLLAGIIVPSTLGFAETADKRDSSNYPSDGSYRIRNLESGLYLTAQIINSKKVSTQNVILSSLDLKDSGQSFLLKTEEDGSRVLIPRNDGGKYSLCSGRPTDAPGELKKSSSRSDGSLFEIFFTDFGGYTIAPTIDGNIYSVLTPSNVSSGNSVLVTVDDYAVGDHSQLWLFEPMEASTGLSVAYKNTKLSLYSTGKFYSRYTPYFGTEPADACWESSDNSIILVGEDGSYSCIGTGTAEVTAFAGGFSASFTVTVVDSDCFTWFSQNNIISSDWNGEALSDLYMMSMGVKKRFAVNDDGHPLYPSWIDTGCALCSIAAVFHNMGAVMTRGYDLRSGQEGGLPADPYTVCMANTLNFEIYDKSKTYSGDPTYMYWQRCSDAFTVDGEKLYYRSVYTQNRNMIKSLLKEHPQGVIAQLQNKVRTHYVVIGECINPTEKVSTNLEFKIYDPAAYNPSDGDGVLMRETTSGKYLSLGYYSISRIIIYDVESKYKN